MIVNRPILLIDDDLTVLKTTSRLLAREGYSSVLKCNQPRQALTALNENNIGLVILDLGMPGVSGLELLEEISCRHPQVPLVVGTSENSLNTALSCIQKGALDYMVKPFTRERLIACVRKGLELSQISEDREVLRHSLQNTELQYPKVFENIITQDDRMLQIFSYLEALGSTLQPVLIYGETGVGKELVANSIHKLSGRSGEFVGINLAGLDDGVFSDTLFGHTRGAFTGAQNTRTGLVSKASKGTLFLDEIGDLSPQSQIKLLRFLQEKEYYPVGSDKPVQADVRIIAATHQDLHKLCEEGQFREDLLYRLKTHHVSIPPLRKRKEDMPLLVEHFLDEFCKSLGCETPSFTQDLSRLLQQYEFPGNVRELRAVLFDLVTNHISRGEGLGPVLISLQQNLNLKTAESSVPAGDSVAFGETLPSIKEVTRLLVEEALRRSEGNQTKAARMLGITQQSLSERVRKWKASQS